MADIFFLIAGIVLFFKKEVRISKKRALTGRPVKILAGLYILPAAVGFIGGTLVARESTSFEFVSILSLILVGIAILVTLYFIIFHREGQTNPHPNPSI